MKPGHLHERASAAGPSVTASTIAIGTCLVLILYGQAMQEAYHYYRRYPKDGYLLKGIITALVICDTVHTIMIAYTCYATLVIASSMPSDGITNFVITTWSFLLVGPTAVITLHLTHCFFARRLFKLGKQPAALRYIVAIMVLGGIGLEILYVVEEFKNGRPSAITPIFILVLLSLSFVLDVVLTSLLVLRLRKSRTGFKSTDNLINRLITFSLNTGLLNGLLTAASVILLVATPQHFAYFPVTAILSPVHISVVLAAVNSRRSLVDRGSEGIELVSFDLDFAPRQEQSTTTSIRWATRSRSGVAGITTSDVSAGTVPVRIQLESDGDDSEEVRPASMKGDSESRSVPMTCSSFYPS